MTAIITDRHMVSEVTSSEGNLVESYDSELVRKTVSEQTADFIKNAMRATVQQDGSTGTYAAIDGYDIGGKTGTAEKLPRSDGKCLVSFISAVPMDDPEVLVYTIIDEPNTVSQADSRLPQILTRRFMKNCCRICRFSRQTRKAIQPLRQMRHRLAAARALRHQRHQKQIRPMKRHRPTRQMNLRPARRLIFREDDTTQNTE